MRHWRGIIWCAPLKITCPRGSLSGLHASAHDDNSPGRGQLSCFLMGELAQRPWWSEGTQKPSGVRGGLECRSFPRSLGNLSHAACPAGCVAEDLVSQPGNQRKPHLQKASHSCVTHLCQRGWVVKNNKVQGSGLSVKYLSVVWSGQHLPTFSLLGHTRLLAYKITPTAGYASSCLSLQLWRYHGVSKLPMPLTGEPCESGGLLRTFPFLRPST
nr:uncharacterized protein LOC106842723 [Equus asinus]